MWFAFENYGRVFDLNGLSEKQLVATGAHGYTSEPLALAHRNKPPNAAQSALLSQFWITSQSPFGGGAMGVLAVDNTTAPPPGPGQKNAPSGQTTDTGKAGTGLPNPLSSIEQFLTILTEKNTWVRVGEVLLGLVLITAGTLKLSEGSGVVASAAKIATKVNPATGVVSKGLKL